MGSTWNMPPGVTTDDIPGNEPSLGRACPNCIQGDLSLVHHEGDLGFPECWYEVCDNCDFQSQPE
jgi:ssDNA-binding Zn-finger/Zn-ribbon topoisomerase 1